MSAFHPQKLRYLLEQAAKEETSSLRGKSYERAIRYAFESSGCLVEVNQTNVGGSEEIDLGIGNLSIIPLLPKIFLVECKDWDHPVDSSTVGYFLNIVRGRGLELGIVVAPKGLTGSDADLTYAHILGLASSAQGVKIIVITSDDLQAIECTAELVSILHRRYLRAQVNGGIGVPLPEDQPLIRHDHDQTCREDGLERHDVVRAANEIARWRDMSELSDDPVPGPVRTIYLSNIDPDEHSKAASQPFSDLTGEIPPEFDELIARIRRILAETNSGLGSIYYDKLGNYVVLTLSGYITSRQSDEIAQAGISVPVKYLLIALVYYR